MAPLSSRRRHELALVVDASREVTITELATRFRVSTVTIRRDVEHLQRVGRVVRVRGGVVSRTRAATATVGRAPSSRQLAIAELAAGVVREGDSVAIAGGPLGVALAHWLAPVRSLSVVTSSIAVANVLHRRRHPGLELTVVGGGVVRGQSSGLVARTALHGIEGLTHVFLQPGGLHAACGATADTLVEGELLAAFAGCAHRRHLLLDGCDWGHRSLVRFLDLREVESVFTDDTVHPGCAALLQRVGVTVHRAVRYSSEHE